MLSSHQSIARLLPAAILLLVLSGCGKSPFTLAPVTGTVTLNGRPITQGKILFRPAKGPMAVGALGPGGRYSLMTYAPEDGAIVGECDIALMPPTYGAPMGDMPPDPPPPPPQETIPAKFHNFSTSGLKRTVVEGQNVFDFELAVSG